MSVEKIAVKTPTRSRWAWLIAVVVVTLLFTVFFVSLSTAFGRLLNDPIWDDVSYFNEGHRYLIAFREGGVPGLIGAYIQTPPHSFYSTLGAAFSFLMFGENAWAPYVINSLVLGLFLGFSVYLFRDRSWWLIVSVFIYILASPLAISAIHDFKPDFLWGLLITIGSLIALRFGLRCQGNLWHFVWGGIFFGLAILAKPTTTPFSLFMAGCAFLASIIQLVVYEKHQVSFHLFVKWGAVFLLPIVLLSSLYFSVGWHHTLEYIKINLFGATSTVWKFRGASIFDTLLYYISGAGSGPLGNYIWIILGLLVFSVIIVMTPVGNVNRSRCVLAVLLCLITYCLVTVNPMKNYYLGLPAQIFLIILPLALLSVLLPQIKNRPIQNIASVVAVIGLILPVVWFHPTSFLGYSYWYWDGDAASRKAIDRALVDAIQNDFPKEAGSRTILVTSTGMVNNDTLTWLLNRDGRDMQSTGLISTDTIVDAVRRADQADYIITAQKGVEGVYGWFPANRYADEIDAAIAAKPRMKKIASVASRTGKEFRVYRNRHRADVHSFFGWNHPVGLIVFQNPNYLFSISKESSVTFSVDQGGSWSVNLAVISKTAGMQKVQIFLDGGPVGVVELPKSNVRVAATLRFRVDPGLHRLSFKPSVFEEFPAKDGKMSSIVFDRLILQPAEL